MKPATALIFVLSLWFVAYSQNRYDIVIDEIMADPSPQIGLPNNEWIELKNTAIVPISLGGWRIGDAAGQSGPMPNFTLQPDSFVIVCAGSAVSALSLFGTTISVTSFPSLDNDADQIYVRAADGRTIHAVAYASSWYQIELKSNGGWSLEMIDSRSPCAGISNWKASTAPKGGTPGRKNAVDGLNDDQTSPRLRYAYTLDSMTVVAVFDEPIDSLKGATPGNYVVDNGISIASAVAVAPLFTTVQLKLIDPLTANKVYTLNVSQVTDCRNNLVGNFNKAKVGVPVEPRPSDIIINEILFNPRSNGYDYLEFFNRSDKIFDVSRLYVANRNNTGIVSSITQLLPTPYYIFPGDYLVVTENATNLRLNYLVENPDAIIELSSLPSFPDDKGDAILLNGQGLIVDEVQYNDDWHFKLIDDPEGISLERIDPAGASQSADNWHSAAFTSGYGTPGYKNSQYKAIAPVAARMEISPNVFSPDNDGSDDVTTLQYEVDAPGYVGNITIFNADGRPVRNLVRNEILGVSGRWNWDGVDDKGNRLPIGIYILRAELFNLHGKKQQFKNIVVLARKLN